MDFLTQFQPFTPYYVLNWNFQIRKSENVYLKPYQQKKGIKIKGGK